jgi:uncharacterized protein (TIGR02118 family)
MKRISILYLQSPGSTFNFDYYINIHMPRSIELLSKHPGFKGVSVEKGIPEAVPGTTIFYTAMCHFLFDSVENFMEAFGPHASELQNDMANYTNIQPHIQFNEVVILK